MNKIAEKFTKLAQGMTAGIANKRRPMTQAATPKRMREYNSRLHDADNEERVQKALLVLAALHEGGNVPPILAGLRAKSEIVGLVYKGTESGGYYDCIPSKEYRNKSELAATLQAYLDCATTPEEAATKQAREKAQEIERMIDKLRFSDFPGFFPTPDALVQRMLDEADIQPGMTILEPSAGIGNIADAIRARHPDADLRCVEIIPCMVNILLAKDHAATCCDFLELGTPRVDRIIQNPPFENLSDIDHVRHAYSLLNPGGRLVSIMSCSAWMGGTRKKIQDFRCWLEEVECEIYDLGGDCFKGVKVFRQTGVSTKLVVIDKG